MHDALSELALLSESLQRRDMTLSRADKKIRQTIRVLDHMKRHPGAALSSAIDSLGNNLFHDIELHSNNRVPKIHSGPGLAKKHFFS